MEGGPLTQAILHAHVSIYNSVCIHTTTIISGVIFYFCSGSAWEQGCFHTPRVGSVKFTLHKTVVQVTHL